MASGIDDVHWIRMVILKIDVSKDFARSGYFLILLINLGKAHIMIRWKDLLTKLCGERD